MAYFRDWEYKVPFYFDVERASDDLEAGRITLEGAIDDISRAVREAASRFPKTEEGEEHSDKFNDIADYIDSQDTRRGVDYYIGELFDYADDNRIWMDDEKTGPMDWRPR